MYSICHFGLEEIWSPISAAYLPKTRFPSSMLSTIMIIDWVTRATPEQIWDTFINGDFHMPGALSEFINHVDMNVASFLEVMDQFPIAFQRRLVFNAHVDVGLIFSISMPWLSLSAISRWSLNFSISANFSCNGDMES